MSDTLQVTLIKGAQFDSLRRQLTRELNPIRVIDKLKCIEHKAAAEEPPQQLTFESSSISFEH